ncbi:hypothetical protein PCANC_07608 [Puccinia coronata f. sp. avenae]|uniref:Uncharacterized protein n=1 Tax=Puccinia coronata f. sp. avenae TaxID=200324 RepID=A0A2N5V9Y3_9BASI|nr:hypothetical protein PCASD_06014 [Puccinia coronata f. sp. avenae]PLW50428.1 hypothetical protein PCANC_07608 [Puccinia coronata f. sp. avenae]
MPSSTGLRFLRTLCLVLVLSAYQGTNGSPSYSRNPNQAGKIVVSAVENRSGHLSQQTMGVSPWGPIARPPPERPSTLAVNSRLDANTQRSQGRVPAQHRNYPPEKKTLSAAAPPFYPSKLRNLQSTKSSQSAESSEDPIEEMIRQLPAEDDLIDDEPEDVLRKLPASPEEAFYT